MKIAVAGAAGFVGSNLIPVLEEHGHDIIALDRAPVEQDVDAAY